MNCCQFGQEDFVKMVNADTLSDVQKQIFDAISKNEIGELKTLLAQLQGTADFVDENGMTPLQHACYKGNTELVQLLLDQVSVWHRMA